MWEISNSGQGNAFLMSVLLGAVLCVLYDLFRLDRIVFRRSTPVVFFEDILFWLIAAFSTFCLLILKTNGQVRAFVIIGIFLGFIIFRCTFSRLLTLASDPLKKAVKKIRKVYSKFVDFLSKIDRYIKGWFVRAADKSSFKKKSSKKQKNSLKNS